MKENSMHPHRKNILNVYQQATPSEIQEGKNWYWLARVTAIRLADRYMLESMQHAAGIIAALSPSVSWSVNVRDAEAICAARQGEQVQCSTYGPNIAKAIRIRDGANPLTVLGGYKVRRFYRCIVDPSCASVVIDRHAMCLAAGITLGHDELKRHNHVLDRYRGFSTVGYHRFERCYQRTARHLEIVPNALQATVWLTWRRLKQVDAIPRHKWLYDDRRYENAND
jgi:hypothetical protein